MPMSSLYTKNRNTLVVPMSPEVTRIKWDRQGSNPIADLGFAVLESPGDVRGKGRQEQQGGREQEGQQGG
jgi:hypothetical protein